MRLLVIVALMLAPAAPAMAMTQNRVVSTQVPNEPTAGQMALSRQVVTLIQTDDLETAIRAMVLGQAGVAPGTEAISVEERQFMIDLSTELASDFVGQVMERSVTIYARTFSETELQYMLDFYKTALGQSILEKQYQMLPEVNAMTLSLMPQMVDKMAMRVCARWGCDVDEMQALLRGGGEPAAPASRSK